MTGDIPAETPYEISKTISIRMFLQQSLEKSQIPSGIAEGTPGVISESI